MPDLPLNFSLFPLCFNTAPVAVVVYQHIKTCQWKRQAAEERERMMAEAAGVGPTKDMKVGDHHLSDI